MTENVNSDDSQAKLANVISTVETTQKKLDQELKDLGKAIDKHYQSINTNNKSIFEENFKKISNSITQLKSQLEDLLNDQHASNSEELLSLKESLDGQLDSLRGYANQLVEDEELKLVTALETSLTNVTDITRDKSFQLNELISKASAIVENSTNAPIDIAQEMNLKVKDELSGSLKLEKDKLTSSIVQLQEEFRDKISTQIEKVFMGVTLTKESVNGIIQDTLSRLEENLNRLNVGIDENFTSEIGLTQDIIHSYEGKLIQAIVKTQENYDKHMEEILNKHSQRSLSSLEELKEKLDAQKELIESDITNLTREQEELVNHSISQLENQIVKSKAEVIESHGVLKDDLGKLLQSNSNTIKESIENIQKNNQNLLSQLLEQINVTSSEQTSTLSENFKTTRKEFEQSFVSVRKDSQQIIDQTHQQLKELGSTLKKERS